MTTETMADLNRNLIGFTDKRGHAWHYRADEQGEESNHYPGAIPVEDVHRRLFNWTPVEGTVETVYLTDDGATRIADPTRKTVIRPDTGTVLGVFKLGYRIHEYRQWLIDGVEEILATGLKIGSAGLLKKGAVAWVQVEMEDTFSACGVDFRPWLTACTSLDGSLATTVLTGSQVVACDNALHAALGAKDALKFKVAHTANSGLRLDEVRAALDLVQAVGANFTAELEDLTAETVTMSRFNRWVAAYTELAKAKEGRGLTMAENKARELHKLWQFDERVAPWTGTAYGVLAAANTYAHHIQTVRNADRVTRNAERVVYGQTQQLDRHALEVLATV